MDGEKFDELIRRLSTIRLTRGNTLRGLVAGAAATLTGATLAADETDAKGKHHKKGGHAAHKNHGKSGHAAHSEGKKGKKKKKKNKRQSSQPSPDTQSPAQGGGGGGGGGNLNALDATQYGCSAAKIALCHNSTANNGGSIICPDASSGDLQGHCIHNQPDEKNPTDCYCPNGGFPPAGADPICLLLKQCDTCVDSKTACFLHEPTCDVATCPKPTDQCLQACCDSNDQCAFCPKEDGSACELDNNLCTPDTCVAGVCKNTGPNVVCDDGDACTTDTCDKTTGSCVHTPISCDDGDACTKDTCDPATGCKHEAISCDDGDACTKDTCDPATGCKHEAISCDDGNKCTTDTCDPATGCVHTKISCDDGNACTTDTCDPATGCVHTPVTCPLCSTCDTASGICKAFGEPCSGFCDLSQKKCNGQVVTCKSAASGPLCDIHGATPPQGSIQVVCTASGPICVCNSKQCKLANGTITYQRDATVTQCTAAKCT